VENKTVKCQNCEVDILESKFPLHESYCLRNVRRCGCGMIVNNVDYDDHFNDFHKVVECSHCKVSMENKEMKDHIRKCIEKPVACQFCQLEVNLSAIKEHEYSCGSKTEQCSNCSKYVQIKDFENHLLRECDPETKLSNQASIHQVPQKKNKASKPSKISAAVSLMNSNNAGKMKVKLDSPFSENFEMVNHHPVSYNRDVYEKKANEKDVKKKKENIDFQFLKSQKFELKARIEKPENPIKEENSEKDLILNNNNDNIVVISENPQKAEIVRKFPYKRATEEAKEESKMKENNNDFQNKKKKGKMKSEYVNYEENEYLAYDDESFKNKIKKNAVKRKQVVEKPTKKQLSEHDFEEANVGPFQKIVEKDLYLNPEDEILRKVLERSRKDM